MKTGIRNVLFLVLSVSSLSSMAQSVTYNHDPMKQAQVTVMESGTGSLTPEWYYTLLHENYSKTAATKNKTLFRTTAGTNLYNQRDFAESIDSSMTKRATIEAMNMADRVGGAADLAWMTEGDKVTNKMNSFKSNIDKIILTGGTLSERDYWQQYYNVYTCAITNTQDAYMPNAQRKREYLQIYEDVSKKNDLLVQYLVRINNRRRMRKRLSAVPDTCKANKHNVSTQAFTRWQLAIGMTGANIIEE